MSAARRLAFDDEDYDSQQIEESSEQEDILNTEMARYYYAERETIDSQVFNRDIFEGCGFSNITFVNCIFDRTIFIRNFEEGQTTYTRNSFHNCEFIDCQFNNCNFDNVSMYFVDFTDCVITNTTMISCRLLDTNFNRCRIISTIPGTRVTPNATRFENCEMCRINFRESQLENVSMGGNLSTVEFIVNDDSGNPTGSITGSSEFTYAVVSRTLMAAIAIGRSRSRLARLAFADDMERIQTTCQSLERERDDFVQDVEEYLARDVESSRGEDRLRVMEEQRRAAAEAVAAIAPEEASVFTGPTCFDIVMQDDEEIQAYLEEDPDNFIIGIKADGKIRYHCNSLDNLKRQFVLDPPPTDRRLPYKVFHECNDDAPVGWQGDTYKDYIKDDGRIFIKITIDMITYIVLKPDWIFAGPVPDPRVFTLEKNPEDVFKFVTSEFIPNFINQTDPDPQLAYGADHCNQQYRQGVYDLVPVTLDANGNVPLTYTAASTGGKRKGRKTRRIKNKNKRYTRKKNNNKKRKTRVNKYKKYRANKSKRS